MNAKLFVGASALALILGASGAKAQVLNLDVDLDINALSSSQLNALLDAGVVNDITGAGDDLSTTLGDGITNAVARADVAVVSAAVNSATVDGSVDVSATPIDLTEGLSSSTIGLGGDLVSVTLPPISVDAGAGLSLTDDTLALSGLVTADIGLAAVIGGNGIANLVQGGTVRINDDIETVAVGASNSADMAILGETAAVNNLTLVSTNGASFSGFDNDLSVASVVLGDNSSTSLAAEFGGFEFEGPDAVTRISQIGNTAGLTDGLLASNLAFNNGFVNGSVNLDGLNVIGDGISTTALGASNSGSLSVGYNGAALNSALNTTKTITVGGGDE